LFRRCAIALLRYFLFFSFCWQSRITSLQPQSRDRGLFGILRALDDSLCDVVVDDWRAERQTIQVHFSRACHHDKF
jgi:hypothetical protein